MLEKPRLASPGKRLKYFRLGLGLRIRDVEVYSRKIADAQRNQDFYISHSSLTEIENSDSTPNVYRLYTLSVVYRAGFIDLLLMYGIDLDQINHLQMAIKLPRTHLVTPQIYDTNRLVSFPIKFDPSARLEESNLLSRMVETWGEIPMAFLQHLGIRRNLYGYIGTEDYTLHPLLRPGSFVVIDDQDTKIQTSSWETEFDRPIYFLQLRDGFACGWCQPDKGTLAIIPYSLSQLPVRIFKYPGDVDVIGRVVGVAMPLTRPSARPATTLESRAPRALGPYRLAIPGIVN